MRTFIRYGFYPLLLIVTLSLAAYVINSERNLKWALTAFAVTRLTVLFWVERFYACRPEWGMTWPSFLRDLKYAVVTGGIIGLVKLTNGWLAIDIAAYGNTGLASLPLFVQFTITLLCYEFFQYWLHRYCHEGRGWLGSFMWRIHVQHHLPQRVYLFMHAIGHPINFMLVMLLNVAVTTWLGVGPDAVYLFHVVMALQGLVSHFNVQISAGPLNYLLVGTELHRQHHSADSIHTGNYGVITPFWDLLFGTFRYTPNAVPHALGVTKPEYYPSSNQLFATLLLPFRPNAGVAQRSQEP